MRQLFNLGGRCRQLAFCSYCGVINENSNTALSHMRKHLNLHFVCGGFYSKSFLNGPALHKHMRTQCPSMMAIRDQSRRSNHTRLWEVEPWDFCGTLGESLLDHTRLLRAEPWDFCPPGCGPYVGSGASDNNVFTFVDLS